MKRICPARPSCRTNPRRGAIIVFGMLALLIVSMLGAALLRNISISRQHLMRDSLHLQAVLLTDAGVARGVSQRKIAADYTGEDWIVPTEQLSGGRTAIVHITVSADPDAADKTLIQSTAEYPQGSPTAIRVTKRIRINNTQASSL